MPCIPSSNKITCFRIPNYIKSVVRTKFDNKIWYCRCYKDIFDVLTGDAKVVLYEIGNLSTKNFMKFGLEWVDTIEGYLEKKMEGEN